MGNKLPALKDSFRYIDAVFPTMKTLKTGSEGSTAAEGSSAAEASGSVKPARANESAEAASGLPLEGKVSAQLTDEGCRAAV